MPISKLHTYFYYVKTFYARKFEFKGLLGARIGFKGLRAALQSSAVGRLLHHRSAAVEVVVGTPK